MTVLNKKGAQPRNREIKGKPFAWPSSDPNNFNWVLPTMPRGFPLKNPKILRIFSNVYEPLKDNVAGSCDAAAIRSCEIRHPGEAALCSMPPDVTNHTSGGTAPMFNFEQIMQNYQCTDHVRIDVFDGNIFRNVNDPPTAVPDAPNGNFTYIEDLNTIIEQLVTANQDKYFVEARSIGADDAVGLCTPKTDLADEIGGYGPWVFNLFFIQNEILNPALWPPALIRYTQQRDPVDRWTKYHTEMGFNIYKCGIQQFTDGVSYTDDLIKRQESWNKIDKSALVGFTDDFSINTFLTPYDRSSASSLGLPYIVDYYQELITNFFEA